MHVELRKQARLNGLKIHKLADAPLKDYLKSPTKSNRPQTAEGAGEHFLDPTAHNPVEAQDWTRIGSGWAGCHQKRKSK